MQFTFSYTSGRVEGIIHKVCHIRGWVRELRDAIVTWWMESLKFLARNREVLPHFASIIWFAFEH